MLATYDSVPAWRRSCPRAYRTGMAEADVSERSPSSLTIRFLDRLSISPALLCFGVAVLATAVLLLAELWSGRLEWMAAHGSTGLRNVRISIVMIAMLTYLPAATLYVVRGARRAAA